MANGSQKIVQSSYTIPIKIENNYYLTNAICVNSLTRDIILGIDLIEPSGLITCKTPLIKQNVSYDDKLPEASIETVVTLNSQEKTMLGDFLNRELKEFENVPGRTDAVKHHIRFLDQTSINQGYYARNPAIQAVIDEKVEKMLKYGVIEPLVSPWSLPVVLIKKSSGKYRF